MYYVKSINTGQTKVQLDFTGIFQDEQSSVRLLSKRYKFTYKIVIILELIKYFKIVFFLAFAYCETYHMFEIWQDDK